MRPVIRSRGRTSIGQAKVGGGSLGYINQAGASGRAAMQMGKALSNIGTVLPRLLTAVDTEVAQESEAQYNRGRKLDYATAYNAHDEANNNNPNYQIGSRRASFLEFDRLWNEANPSDPNVDDSAFGLYRQLFITRTSAALEIADVKERVVAVKANEASSFNRTMDLISSAGSVEEINNLKDIYSQQPSSRFFPETDRVANQEKINNTALERGAMIRAYSGSPDGEKTSEAHANAIRYLSIQEDGGYNEPTMDLSRRNQIINSIQQSKNIKESREEHDLSVANNKETETLYTLLESDKLTEQRVLDSSLPGKNKQVFLKMISSPGKIEGSAEFGEYSSKILNGSLFDTNDLHRYPDNTINRMVTELQDTDIGPKELGNLMKLARNFSKQSPQQKSLKDALIKVKSWITSSYGGTGFGGTSIQARRAISGASINISTALEAGYERGLTMEQMLSPTIKGDVNGDYIVEDIIDQHLHSTDPVDIESVERPDSGWFYGFGDKAVEYINKAFD